jgi:hypothetical protein
MRYAMDKQDRAALDVAIERINKRLGKAPERPPEYCAVYSLRAVHASRVRILRKWLRLTIKSLEWEIADIELEIEDIEEEGEDYHWLENDLMEESAYYLYEVPVLFYQYLLVSCFAQFEYALGETCKRFARIQGKAFTLKDLRGSHIDKCRTYFKTVLCLPFPDDTQTWADLKTIGWLRNCIVHRDGNWKGHRREQQIRALMKRIASDIPPIDDSAKLGFYAELATDEKAKSEVAVWKGLCEKLFSTWTQFIKALADRLAGHFSLDSGHHMV